MCTGFVLSACITAPNDRVDVMPLAFICPLCGTHCELDGLADKLRTPSLKVLNGSLVRMVGKSVLLFLVLLLALP